MTAQAPDPTSSNGRSPSESAPTISLVIPAKNEAKNLPWVLKRIPPSVTEVILVDGRSVDDTIAVAQALRPDIRIVSDDRPGKGAALQAGFAAARGDYIVMIDADCSMDPAEIDRFAAELSAGRDFVKGSRFTRGGGTADMSPLRRLGNFGFVVTTNVLFNARYTDLCYGYMAFRRTALPSLNPTADGFEIETQLVVHAVKSGLRVAEVPSFEAPRRYGASNLNTWRDGWRVLKTILRERAAVQVGAGAGRRWTADEHRPAEAHRAADAHRGAEALNPASVSIMAALALTAVAADRDEPAPRSRASEPETDHSMSAAIAALEVGRATTQAEMAIER